MRYEQIRCDFCKSEVFYTENGQAVSNHFKKDDIIELSRLGIKNKFLCDKHYCSPECFKFALEEIILSKPTDIDYLKCLAEKNGFELKKKQINSMNLEMKE